MRRWRLTYHKSRKKYNRGLWLENASYQYGQPKDSFYAHLFTEEEFRMLKFLFIELHDVIQPMKEDKQHKHGHDFKRIQQWLGNIVYNKLNERE